MSSLLVTELARQFWERAGEPGDFPRDLGRAVSFALPLVVVQLPSLRVAAAAAWLLRRGSACLDGIPDRPLRACLVAHRGQGLVFIDGTDPHDERRFSLAHEVAHFLADYWWPRTRAERRVGPGALEVLDGLRPPTRAERIDALLAHVTLGTHLHLMERTPDGHPAGVTITQAEQTADDLALELLAPADAVGEALGADDSVAMLVERFGLPPAVAGRYADRLRQPEPPADTLFRRLGLVEPRDLSKFAESTRKKE